MNAKPTSEQLDSAKALVEAIRYSGDGIDSLLAHGADPYINVFGITTRVRMREHLPETALEWAALRNRPELVSRFLDMPGELDAEAQSKLLGIASLGCSIESLEIVYDRYKDTLDMSRAFAYCITRGFKQGALFLYERDAFDMCEDWIERSSRFESFLMPYSHFNGMPRIVTTEDFFAYLFPIPRIEAALQSRDIPPANTEKRFRTLDALSKKGMLTLEIYSQYAERAILFDRCDLLGFLDSISGFDAVEIFKTYPGPRKNLWIVPNMSPDKVEFVAKVLGPEFKFPIAAHFLVGPKSVRALIAHSDAEHTKHPDLLVRYLIQTGLDDCLSDVADWGGITADNIEELLAFAHECENTRAAALLVEYRNAHFGDADPFADLSGELL